MAELWNQTIDGRWQHQTLPEPASYMQRIEARDRSPRELEVESFAEPVAVEPIITAGTPTWNTQRWHLSFRRISSGIEQRTLLLKPASQRVWVNGVPLSTDAQLLRSRDEILVDGGDGRMLRWVFVDEAVARVAPFEPLLSGGEFLNSSAPSDCPRCQQPIELGTDSVRCPRCAVACHQSRDLGCWTYTPNCPNCGASTALTPPVGTDPAAMSDASEHGDRWTPVSTWGGHQ